MGFNPDNNNDTPHSALIPQAQEGKHLQQSILMDRKKAIGLLTGIIL